MLNNEQVMRFEEKTDFIGEKKVSKGKYIYSHFIRRKISAKLYNGLQKG